MKKIEEIKGHLTIFDVLAAMEKDKSSEVVDLKGMINFVKGKAKHYEVSLAYGDVILIISMLHDYVRGLDELRCDQADWHAYYRKKFLGISERLESAMEYDYEKKRQECLKKAAKAESKSDVGAEALSLLLKR